jgi:hypothetical protein
MSLVGPRPCVSYEYEKYLPWQRERFDTLPGLTGLWQVSGKNRSTFTEMMELDIKYAREKTLGIDLKIIFKTIPALLVQIWDTKFKKDSRPQPVEIRMDRSRRPGSQRGLPGTAFMTIARVAGDTEHRNKM